MRFNPFLLHAATPENIHRRNVQNRLKARVSRHIQAIHLGLPTEDNMLPTMEELAEAFPISRSVTPSSNQVAREYGAYVKLTRKKIQNGWVPDSDVWGMLLAYKKRKLDAQKRYRLKMKPVKQVLKPVLTPVVMTRLNTKKTVTPVLTPVVTPVLTPVLTPVWKPVEPVVKTRLDTKKTPPGISQKRKRNTNGPLTRSQRSKIPVPLTTSMYTTPADFLSAIGTRAPVTRLVSLCRQSLPAAYLTGWLGLPAKHTNRTNIPMDGFMNLATMRYWVLLEGTTPLGFAAGCQLHPHKVNNHRIFYLIVICTSSSKGGGTRLMHAVEEEARALGCTSLWLSSVQQMTPVYRKWGFNFGIGNLRGILGIIQTNTRHTRGKKREKALGLFPIPTPHNPRPYYIIPGIGGDQGYHHNGTEDGYIMSKNVSARK